MHSRRGELNSPAHDTDKFPNIRSFIPTQKPKKQNHLPQKKGFGANKRSEPNDIN